MQTKKSGGGVRSRGWGWVGLDVNQELKLLLRCKKVGWGRGSGREGVRG